MISPLLRLILGTNWLQHELLHILSIGYLYCSTLTYDLSIASVWHLSHCPSYKLVRQSLKTMAELCYQKYRCYARLLNSHCLREDNTWNQCAFCPRTKDRSVRTHHPSNSPNKTAKTTTQAPLPITTTSEEGVGENEYLMLQLCKNYLCHEILLDSRILQFSKTYEVLMWNKVVACANQKSHSINSLERIQKV